MDTRRPRNFRSASKRGENRLKSVGIVTDFRAVSFLEVSRAVGQVLKKNGVNCKIYDLTHKRVEDHNILFVGNIFHLSISYIQRFLPNHNVIFYAITEGVPILDSMSHKLSEKITYITPSLYTKQCLEQAGLNCEDVIPHGIALNEKYDKRFHDHLKQSIPQPSKVEPSNIMLCVSGNWRRKALDKLLIAYKTVEKITKDAFLILHSGIGDTNIVDLQQLLELRRFWLTNMWGTLTQPKLTSLYALCNFYVQPSMVEGFGLCLHPETRIITKNGLQSIKEVEIGDKVLTHSRRWKGVQKIFKRKINGRLFCIIPWGSNKPIKLTAEHPVLAIKRGARLHRDWIPASELQKGDRVIFPIPQRNNNQRKFYNLKHFGDVEASRSRVSFKMGFSPRTGEKVKVKKEIPLDERLARLFGLYIAEGSVNKNQMGAIEFSFGDEPILIYETAKLMKELFDVNAYLNVSSKQCNVIFSGKILANFFSSLCGVGARHKKIPNDLLYGKVEFLKELVEYYLKGDGCVHGDTVIAETVSEQLATDLKIAFLRLGYKPIVHAYTRPEYNGAMHYRVSFSRKNVVNNYHSNKSWFVGRSRNNRRRLFAVLIKEVYDEPYEGEVFNLEVETDNSYSTESFVVHNCYLEAFRFNRPVIGVNCPATNEIVKDGYTGLLLPVTKTEDIVWQQRHAIRLHHFELDSLIDAMLILTDEKTRNHMAENIKKEKHKWDYQTHYKKFLKWLD